MKMLPIRAVRTASQCTFFSAAQARAVPTATGVIERLSVRGRAAMIQDDGFAIKLIVQSTNFVAEHALLSSYQQWQNRMGEPSHACGRSIGHSGSSAGAMTADRLTPRHGIEVQHRPKAEQVQS